LFLRSIKLNIFLHLAMLLALAMLMADIVLMWGFQNILINGLISKAALISSVVQAGHFQAHGDDGPDLRHANILQSLINKAGSAYCLVLDKDRRMLAETGALPGQTGPGDDLAGEAMVSGEKIIRFYGSTWGLFWKQKEHLIVATPLMDGKTAAGAVVMAFDLKKTFAALRHMQGMVWPFLFFNLIALSAIGLFRISKTTVKPVQRLLNRAEEYTEDDPVFFSDERKNSEFNRLSFALNRLLARISEDRNRLRETISSLKKANAELEKAQEDVVRAEKFASVGRLASGVAHEIGNPMGIILGYLDLLKQADLPECDKKDFILRAEKEIRRINSIIRRLLDFSRASSDIKEAFSVHHVIEELGSMVAPQPFMADIAISIEPLARRDMVLGDPNALRQVFLNLLINAADAIALEDIPGPGRVQIITENIDPFEFKSGCLPAIKILCKDNGPGISPKDAKNIFDPFFTTKEPGKGTGLGLSVSFMLVENMGGKIEAVDKTDAGAEIAVILPLFQTN
jgi:two-component system, NtrC family, sensor kinase